MIEGIAYPSTITGDNTTKYKFPFKNARVPFRWKMSGISLRIIPAHPDILRDVKLRCMHISQLCLGSQSYLAETEDSVTVIELISTLSCLSGRAIHQHKYPVTSGELGDQSNVNDSIYPGNN